MKIKSNDVKPWVIVVFMGVFLSACNTGPFIECESVKPYNGADLYAMPSIPAFEAKAFDGSFDGGIELRLNAALDSTMSSIDALSLNVTVGIMGEGIWTGSPMQYWASGGKTLTALTVLKFMEDGKLSLSDSVSKFVDNVPNGDLITIEMLLNHTSGLFSVNEDKRVRQEHRALSLDEVIEILHRHGPMFCPGENWRYTNTGYFLLGHILECIEGKPFHEVITGTVLNPLKLENIRVLKSNDPAKDVTSLYTSDPGEKVMDISSAGAAGPMVASSEAVVLFWQSVLSGKIISKKNVKLMYEELYPMFGGPTCYGLGMMVYRVPEPNGETTIWLGHSGGANGVAAIFAYVPSQQAFVAVSLSGKGSAEAVVYAMLKAIKGQ